MTNANRLTDLLGVRYPIIQGGLAYVANGRLAAAVSEAGGFGQVGAAGRTPEGFRTEIQVAKQHTNQPFGVNIPVSRHADHAPYFQVVEQERNGIAAVSLSAGDPRPYIPRIQAMGLRVLLVVATVRQAVRAEEAGADAVICEGFEAGGHDGPNEETVFALVPQVASRVSVPVVAAGGVATGRQLVAAVALGASGVQLGTRFVATEECEAHPAYKDQIVAAADDGTTVIERPLGVSTRVLKNSYANAVLAMEAQGVSREELITAMRGELNRRAAIEGRLEEGYMYAGQSAGMIDEVLPVRAVIEQMMREAKATWLQMADHVRFML